MSIIKNEILNLLKEDEAMNDVTTNSTIITNKKTFFRIISKNYEDFTLCGIEAIKQAFACLTVENTTLSSAKNGDTVPQNGIIYEGECFVKEILQSERVVLNIIQHLSAIATKTKKFIKTLNDDKIQILDTRKTSPYLRRLQKYAVNTGGGTNHRNNLADMVMIKDNHIIASGGIKNAIRLAKKNAKGFQIEIECDTLAQVEEASLCEVDVIMLDNMPINDIIKSSKIIRKLSKSKIEVSGGINLQNIANYKGLDVDFISIGALTHSVEAVDISLEIL